MSKSTGTLGKYQTDKFKRCTIKLQPTDPNFGFTLNSKIKPKYMIFNVENDSPASKANLRTSDVIVEINKENIRRFKFDKVKKILSDARNVEPRQVEILVISKEGYLYYKNKKKRFSSKNLVTTDNTEIFVYPEPRKRDYSSENGEYTSVFLAIC